MIPVTQLQSQLVSSCWCFGIKVALCSWCFPHVPQVRASDGLLDWGLWKCESVWRNSFLLQCINVIWLPHQRKLLSFITQWTLERLKCLYIQRTAVRCLWKRVKVFQKSGKSFRAWEWRKVNCHLCLKSSVSPTVYMKTQKRPLNNYKLK